MTSLVSFSSVAIRRLMVKTDHTEQGSVKVSTGFKHDTNEDEYHVVSVDETDPPDGFSVGNWHRYVIERGKSTIEGFKPGTLKSVTEHAKHVAEDINERATTFGQPVYYQTTRKRK